MNYLKILFSLICYYVINEIDLSKDIGNNGLKETTRYGHKKLKETTRYGYKELKATIKYEHKELKVNTRYGYKELKANTRYGCKIDYILNKYLKVNELADPKRKWDLNSHFMCP